MKKINRSKPIAEWPEFDAIEAKLDEVLDLFIEQDFPMWDRDRVLQYFGTYAHTLGWHPFEVMWRFSSPSIKEIIRDREKKTIVKSKEKVNGSRTTKRN